MAILCLSLYSAYTVSVYLYSKNVFVQVLISTLCPVTELNAFSMLKQHIKLE